MTTDTITKACDELIEAQAARNEAAISDPPPQRYAEKALNYFLVVDKTAAPIAKALKLAVEAIRQIRQDSIDVHAKIICDEVLADIEALLRGEKESQS